MRPLAAGADAVRGPAIGVRFTGARASRCRADAKPGSQPAARAAASTAAARAMPDGHLEAGDARPRDPPTPRLTSPAPSVRVSRASVRRGAVDEGDAARAVRGRRPVRHERRAVLDQLALDGVRRVVRRLEAGPVRPVRGVLPARRAVGAGPRSVLGADRIPRRPRRGGRGPPSCPSTRGSSHRRSRRGDVRAKPRTPFPASNLCREPESRRRLSKSLIGEASRCTLDGPAGTMP